MTDLLFPMFSKDGLSARSMVKLWVWLEPDHSRRTFGGWLRFERKVRDEMRAWASWAG
jgi:hypothetical protein